MTPDADLRSDPAPAAPAALWLAPLALLLVAAAVPMPYGFYVFLRFAVCIAAGVLAWNLRGAGNTPWLFVGLAVLYNPIVRIHLDRETWAVLNVLSALPFAWIGWANRKRTAG